MFYFAGIYKCNQSPVSGGEIKRLLYQDGETNCTLFIENNFGVGFKCPGEAKSRLSIPEFSQNAQKNITVVFEGRLDNVLELVRFLPDNLNKKSGSYGEIICYLYELNGPGILSHLKGVFVFVLWDKKNNNLILSRDIIGLKPLYYCMNNGSFVFATLVNVILRGSDIKKEINLSRVYNYFILDGLNLGKETEYKNIYNVAPGNMLIVDRKGIKENKIFNLNTYDLGGMSEQEISERYSAIIEKSIDSYLSDSKVAIAFSGGIDTNTIIAVCAKHNIQIDTFTVKFLSQSKAKILDYQIASERSKEFSAQHHELRLDPAAFINTIDETAKRIDRLVSLDYLNNVYILKWIAAFSDFVLTGDGTEEQLGSYRYTWFAYYADQCLRNSSEISIYTLNNFIDAMFFYRTGWLPGSNCMANNLFNKNTQHELSGYDVQKVRDACLEQSINTDLARWKDYFPPSVLNKCFWIDFFNFFCPNKLLIADLISRNYSIEIALPFLNEDFVSFSMQIPAEFKCKGFEKNQTKYIFRSAVSKFAGKENSFLNFKSGSDIPYNEWLVDPHFEKYVRYMLDSSRVRKSGILNEKYVRKIVDQHYSNKELYAKQNSHWIYKKGPDYRGMILKLLGFQLWWENNFL